MRYSANNLLTAWETFTSKKAIAIYLSVLMLSIAVLVIAIMVSEHRRAVLQARSNKAVEVVNSGGTGGTSTQKNAKKEDNVSRFFMLTQTDLKMANKPKPHFNDTLTLKELCERFRNFAASRLGLYYEESDIRQFIAGLSVSHILIMQGMSGTGKTSLAYAFG
ncbi:MAG: hypothetical protein IJ393_00360, partial [Clostridia bacterium]|nr:hypothetical protein [Clostridia bacterium]